MNTLKYFERTWFKVTWQAGIILVLAVAVGLAVNQVRPGGLPLVADWSPEARLQLGSGDTLVVEPDEAQALFVTQSAIFVDARARAIFEEGHIQGAFNLPVEDIDNYFEAFSATVPPEATIVAYCDGESCNSSKELALALLDRGYPNVHVLVNGWTVWQQRNLPIEKGDARSSEITVSQ